MIYIKEVKIEEAGRLIQQFSKPVTDTEMLEISEAVGRILAEDVYAEFDDPPFDRSPLDGYAVRSEDVLGASKERPVKLQVIDEISAGKVSYASVEKGQAVRIMTGAPIPDGADCVIKQENTDYGSDHVMVFKPAGHYENYCFAGEDHRAGQQVLKKGRKLTFIEIGILATLGKTEIEVYRRVRAAVIATGDEILMPGSPLPPGKIYNSNMFMIKAGLIDSGAEVVYCKYAPDSPEVISEMLKAAAEAADIIITTGGVSVGKKDCIPYVIEMTGMELIFNRVSIKPGAPTTFSVFKGRPVLSLSGSPFGAAVNFNILAKPALAVISRDNSLELSYKNAVFRGRFNKASKRTRYIRGVYYNGEVVQSDHMNPNGTAGNIRGCNCYIEIPAGTPALYDGEDVRVINI